MKKLYIGLLFVLIISSCSQQYTVLGPVYPPNPTPKVQSIDRFGDNAILFKRSIYTTLPGSNVAINFNLPPFYAVSLDSAGKSIGYFNFDMWDLSLLDTAYLVTTQSTPTTLTIQDIIFNKLPGDNGYNDIKAIHLYVAANGYVSGNLRSYSAIQASIKNGLLQDLGYYDQLLFNIPLVPYQSTLNGMSPSGFWYNNNYVYGFVLSDSYAPVNNQFPNQDIDSMYVCFNRNVGGQGGTLDSLASLINSVGYREISAMTQQTHNIIRRSDTSVSAHSVYTSVRMMMVYDTASFNNTLNYDSTQLMTFKRLPFIMNNSSGKPLYINAPTLPLSSAISSSVSQRTPLQKNLLVEANALMKVKVK